MPFDGVANSTIVDDSPTAIESESRKSTTETNKKFAVVSISPSFFLLFAAETTEGYKTRFGIQNEAQKIPQHLSIIVDDPHKEYSTCNK